MSTNNLPDPLDRALDALPREVAPSAQLWSRIAAEISSSVPDDLPISSASTNRKAALFTSRYRWMQLAAGVLLIVTSSLTTWFLVQRSMQAELALAAQSASRVTVQQMQPVLGSMPVSFGAQASLGEDYLKARAELTAQFERRVAMLPPITRARVERDLAELRRAASEISAALNQDPSDSLLQQLLLTSYQSELALLGNVNELMTPAVAGVDL